jgi:metallo-beta-lactamase family protein
MLGAHANGGTMTTHLMFHGAAGTVTGSCSLIEADSTRFLVDCGLYQGNRTVRDLNDRDFPFDPSAIDFLVLTHAHIDHSGLVPKLVKEGFQGQIYATRATVDLLQFMLADSAHIQQANAERHNRKRLQRGRPPVEPAYTMEHVEAALERMQAVDYEQWLEPRPSVRVRLWNAGHILGSASAEVVFNPDRSGNTLRLLFSGDLGPDQKVFHPEPEAPEGFDYVVCESTYGDRERADYTLDSRREVLRAELTEGIKRGGNVVIPAFALERSQELLHDIHTLLVRKEIPEATVYLDSPLARKATEVFMRYADSLEDVEIPAKDLFHHPRFKLVQTVQESKNINGVAGGAIIISASGMCDAGRIKHHLRANIWRPEATVLFVGYQAPGTLGHIISHGAEKVRIHGREFTVAARIRQIGNYSAHADQSELADWVMERLPVAGRVFLNHGDDPARKALAQLLVARGLEPQTIVLPAFDERFELVAGAAVSKGRAVERIDDAALARDWHSDYAVFILRLAEQLRATPSDVERRAIIRKLEEAMEGP